MPFHNFEDGDIVSAAQMDDLQSQANIPFDSAAQRDAVLTSPTEGMVAYLRDTDQLTYYNGTQWVTTTPGAWITIPSSWMVAGYTVAGQYRITGKTVEFRGQLGKSGGFPVASTTVATIPVGLRPDYIRQYVTAASWLSTLAVRIDVNTAGQIIVLAQSAHTWVAMDGIHYEIA